MGSVDDDDVGDDVPRADARALFDEDNVKRRGGKGTTDDTSKGGKGKTKLKLGGNKTHTTAPRPGEIGFEGLDDGGRSQSLYKGMSRAAVTKALEKKQLGDAALHASPSSPPPLDAPEVVTPIIDACAHLHVVVERACVSQNSVPRTLRSAWSLGDPDALQCAPVGAVVHVTCDPESLDPSYGGSSYRAWERLWAGDDAEEDDLSNPEVLDGDNKLDTDDKAAGETSYNRSETTTHTQNSAASASDAFPKQSNVYFAFGVYPRGSHELDGETFVGRVVKYVHEMGHKTRAIGVCGVDFGAKSGGAGACEDKRQAQVALLTKLLAVARGEGRGYDNDGDGDGVQTETKRVFFSRQNPLPVLLVALGGAEAETTLLRLFAEHQKTCVSDGASFVPAILLDPSPNLAALALATFPDVFVSVSGAVTHSKNVGLLAVVFDTPMDRMLLGSEAPGKMPTQLVGRRVGKNSKKQNCNAREWSHPAGLVFAAAKIAAIKGRGVTAENVVAAASGNAKRVFRLE